MAMQCRCCGRWTVEDVQLIPTGWRRPRHLLRLRDGARTVLETSDPDALAAYLASWGVLHQMRDVDRLNIPRTRDPGMRKTPPTRR